MGMKAFKDTIVNLFFVSS